jgi:glycosyltransferase involved in cell wall biosynthesis
MYNPKKNIVFLFPTDSRISRIDKLNKKQAPKDFFYGISGLREKNYYFQIVNTRENPKSLLGFFLLKSLNIISRLLKLGFNIQRVRNVNQRIRDSKIAISFTDSFSISLGLYYIFARKLPTYLYGGFHGLSDSLDYSRLGCAWINKIIIKIALSRLNHIFFFGDSDRKKAIEIFDIPPKKTSTFLFGVDINFWKPSKKKINCGILSVGSDLKRDYETLIKANIFEKITIITSHQIRPPFDKVKNIRIISGNIINSEITDIKLRNYYQMSSIVITPLYDVWQPSGYSVTLQAMACGKAVILSNIKGLWDKNVFKSGKNCILVEPGNIEELENAVELLRLDKRLRNEIEREARKTAELYFSHTRMETSLKKLLRRNLN